MGALTAFGAAPPLGVVVWDAYGKRAESCVTLHVGWWVGQGRRVLAVGEARRAPCRLLPHAAAGRCWAVLTLASLTVPPMATWRASALSLQRWVLAFLAIPAPWVCFTLPLP